MKIMVLGLRGFPNVMGGIETHCENVCPRLKKLGCDIEVIARSPYVDHDELDGIRFKRIWAPKQKSLETILHTFLGVAYAAIKRPDILHIHAVGPALMTPFARMAGLRVVVTHHGEDYHRQKWGLFARLILRAGEAMGMLFATQRIVISQTLRQLVLDKYGKPAFLIPNGVNFPDLSKTGGDLTGFGLEKNRYVLTVGRLVPEKRHSDLIAAFSKAALPGWKLAIVGDSDHPDEYSREIFGASSVNPNIVCTGFQSGAALHELFANAGIFVLPSSHEGNPIALLEALSYGLPALVSDIPAHLELELPQPWYFPVGDVNALSAALIRESEDPLSVDQRREIRERIRERFDWDKVAERTVEVYQACRV